jgi:hypothetical protein
VSHKAAAWLGLTVEASQLVAEKGQVRFDALSLYGRARRRQLNLAGNDQLFDDLTGRA